MSARLRVLRRHLVCQVAATQTQVDEGLAEGGGDALRLLDDEQIDMSGFNICVTIAGDVKIGQSHMGEHWPLGFQGRALTKAERRQIRALVADRLRRWEEEGE